MTFPACRRLMAQDPSRNTPEMRYPSRPLPEAVAMTPEFLFKRLAKLNVWKKGGRRAPHKPLLLLHALSRARRSENRLQTYAEVEPALRDLLARFGPPRRGPHEPIHPFVRLTKDKLWEIPDEARLPRTADGKRKPTAKITARELNDLQDLEAGLPEDLYNALRDDHDLLRRAAEFLVEKEFPQSYHQELLGTLGLDDLDTLGSATHVANAQTRNPRFRDRVIAAYEHRCAICSYDIRMNNQLLGLEAAHILWRSRGGPDEVPNGLALCTLHHNALDRGGITVKHDMTLLVSPHLHGEADAWFRDYEGKAIWIPRDNRHRPNSKYLAWHRREVFRGNLD